MKIGDFTESKLDEESLKSISTSETNTDTTLSEANLGSLEQKFFNELYAIALELYELRYPGKLKAAREISNHPSSPNLQSQISQNRKPSTNLRKASTTSQTSVRFVDVANKQRRGGVLPAISQAPESKTDLRKASQVPSSPSPVVQLTEFEIKKNIMTGCKAVAYVFRLSFFTT